MKNVSIIGLHWGAYYQNEPQAIAGVDLPFAVTDVRFGRGYIDLLRRAD